MYEAVTRGIRMRVTPHYLEEQSTPDESEFFWAYTIDIANEGRRPCSCARAHWRITDGHGQTEEVRGPGVVGETPVHPRPAKSFSYTSGCPLRDAVRHHGRQLPDDDATASCSTWRSPPSRSTARSPSAA